MSTETEVRRVVQKGSEWFVMSEDGKKQLGGPYKTKEEADKRLGQIEYFKHQGDRALDTLDRECRHGDGIELRSAPDGSPSPGTLVGYAARFNRLSEPLKDKTSGSARRFRERVMPGAFTRTLQSADVRALFGHDENMVLGRNRSGTLRLAEDGEGLRVEIDLPDTTAGRDAAVSVGRGDITGMSFGFYTPKGGDRWDRSGEMPVRSLHDIDIDDVSLVAYPAYPDTKVALRSLERAELEESGDDDNDSPEEEANESDAEKVAEASEPLTPFVPPLKTLLAKLATFE